MPSQSLLFLTYLNTVFDHINDAILLIAIENGNYRVLMINERFAEVSHGVYSTKNQGQLVKDSVPPDAYKDLAEQYAAVAKKKEIVDYVSHDVTTGEKYTFHTKFIPILNAFEECTHIVAIITDITELEALKAEVKKLRCS